MGNIPSAIDPTSLSTKESNDLIIPKQGSVIEHIDKELYSNELRRKMHQDLIDDYDEELDTVI